MPKTDAKWKQCRPKAWMQLDYVKGSDHEPQRQPCTRWERKPNRTPPHGAKQIVVTLIRTWWIRDCKVVTLICTDNCLLNNNNNPIQRFVTPWFEDCYYSLATALIRTDTYRSSSHKTVPVSLGWNKLNRVLCKTVTNKGFTNWGTPSHNFRLPMETS